MEAPASASASVSPEDTQPVGDNTTRDPLYSPDSLRHFMEQWVEISEVSNVDSIPPVCMVMFPDLLERVWGWEKLLPDVHASVEWHDYKSYLVLYLEKNALKVPTGKDALLDAVSRCIEAERRLGRTCNSFLSYEEFRLTDGIKVLARDLVQSDGEYPAAIASLLAITTEAELMCEMTIQGYCTSAVRDLAHQIRQAAFHLILYGGSESAAVTGAMLGLFEDSKLNLDALHEGHSAYQIYYETVKIRQGIAKVLTKLDEELGCKTTGNAGALTTATKKPIGDGVVEDSGHALKNKENETKAVASPEPLW